MKNSLFIIAGLLVLPWAIVTLGFNSFRYIDILLLLAVFIVFLRILFTKKLSKEPSGKPVKNHRKYNYGNKI